MGHVLDHFSDLQRFAFASACLRAQAYNIAVRVDQEGCVSLPGLDLRLSLGQQHAGKVVGLKTNGNRLTASWGGSTSTIALKKGFSHANDAAGAWTYLPRVGWGITLNDSLEMSRVHCSSGTRRLRKVDANYYRSWAALGAEACNSLSLIENQVPIPVRSVLKSIVPLNSPRRVSLSSTSPETLGCISASLPQAPLLLGETLVHEAAHTLLQMSCDEVPYWTSVGTKRAYRSPWRTDLRPISGLVHGIFAFVTVGEYWAALFQQGLVLKESRLGRMRLRQVTRQVEEALCEIGGSDELTDAGRALTGSVRRRMDGLGRATKTFPPAPSDARKISTSLTRHRRVLTPPRVLSSSTRRGKNKAWSQALGAAMPPEPNHAECKCAQMEEVTDLIHFAAHRNQASTLRKWARLIKRTKRSERESALLVQGSIHYGRGEFRKAVRYYAAYVELRWKDLDAWRLLAAALRCAHENENSLMVAFDLERICRHNPASLRRRFGPDWPFRLVDQDTA
jgi:HEXXH motif-containing protein